LVDDAGIQGSDHPKEWHEETKQDRRDDLRLY